MARRNDHSREEIRDMAVNAVLEIAREKGYAGVTARAVAAAIGYTVGTLYLVFKNLDDLVLHANARTLDSLYNFLTDRAEAATDPASRLLAFGLAYVEFAATQPLTWSMLYELKIPEGETDPDWFKEKVGRYFQPLESALTELAPTRTEEDVSLAARALWGGVHGVCVLAATNKLAVANVGTASSLASSLIKRYIRGWRAEDEQEGTERDPYS